MNQKMLIILGAVVLLIAGVGGFFVINSSNSTLSDKSMVKDDKMMDDKDSMEKNDKISSSSSIYIEYSKANLDNSTTSKRVLFFYASWCPTCRPADENIKNNLDRIPKDMTIIRVNYNDPDTDEEEKDLAKKYNITYQHTFVQIDSNGNEITKWNGGQIDEILANIK